MTARRALDPDAEETGTSLMRTRGLTKRFPVGGVSFGGERRWVHAVDSVDLEIPRGRTLAVVGESGSGKTTLGQLIAGLLEPSSGSIDFDGQDLMKITGSERRRIRRRLQFVFQDPFSSLNPRHTIRTILSRPFAVHTDLDREGIDSEIRSLLDLVGLGHGDSGRLLDRHPHQFSGGQRQRLVFARAIALRPEFIVADEPVSSLDMSVKAQLLTLLRRFQHELGLTYLFITHELAVVRTIAADVAVMYLGRIVEHAPSVALFDRPYHPYTVALLSATPILDPVLARSRIHVPLGGTLPSPVSPPTGCHFNTRCPYAQQICQSETPELRSIGVRRVACHFVGDPAFPLTRNVPTTDLVAARATARNYPAAASPATPSSAIGT
jgi:oligopeptide/dipeptide ABC transporter ATP-binding protein